MKMHVRSLLLLSILLWMNVSMQATEDNDKKYSIQQLHVVFRHGNRTPDFSYPTDPYNDYNWAPMGWNQLSLAGMKSTFELGRFFREKYDSFLGDVYRPNDVNASSTDYPRTKQCLLLFLAGAYPPPPSQQWDKQGLGSLWLPVIYSYLPSRVDNFYNVDVQNCPKYQQEFEDAKNGDFTRAVLDMDKELVDVVVEKAQLRPPLVKSIHDLYGTLNIEAYENLPLPMWVQPFYPTRLEKIALQYLHQRALTRSMQKLITGPLIKHMVSTMTASRNGEGSKQPRVWIYSGHDTTVSSLGLALRAWGPIYPSFNAMFVIELLKDDAGQFFVQVKYRNSHASPLEPVSVGGCGLPCPLDSFHELVRDVIPRDYYKECHERSGASPNLPSIIFILTTSILILSSRF